MAQFRSRFLMQIQVVLQLPLLFAFAAWSSLIFTLIKSSSWSNHMLIAKNAQSKQTEIAENKSMKKFPS